MNNIEHNIYVGTDCRLGYVRTAMAMTERHGLPKEFINTVRVIEKYYDKSTDEIVYLCEGDQFSPVPRGDSIPFYTALFSQKVEFVEITKIQPRSTEEN